MTDREKYDARMEIKQQRLEAGYLSKRFPEVSRIFITMTDKQKGINPTSILRTFNFMPNSYAYFHIGCLNKDCVEGGYDLNQIITTMIKYHREAGEGELVCDGSNRYSDHSMVHYEISVEYMMNRNLGADDTYKESRSENLRLIRKILFDHNGTAIDQLSDESKTNVIELISELEKSKNTMPDSCRKDLQFIIDSVRNKCIDLKGGI